MKSSLLTGFHFTFLVIGPLAAVLAEFYHRQFFRHGLGVAGSVIITAFTNRAYQLYQMLLGHDLTINI